MEELDLLKKAWKKEANSFEQVTENDIYKMLHKQSSSIVKLILIISILEVLLWTSMSLFFNPDEYFRKIHSENMLIYFKVMNYFNYAVIVGFIYLFYKNYKKISTTVATKHLMKDILKTRKTVQIYVWYNLGMIVLSMFFGFILAFMYNPEMNGLKERISQDNNHFTLIATLFMLLIIATIIVGVFWLFYRLLYGILLKKLNTNYNELKKIDL